jgi:hypothetical protein
LLPPIEFATFAGNIPPLDLHQWKTPRATAILPASMRRIALPQEQDSLMLMRFEGWD